MESKTGEGGVAAAETGATVPAREGAEAARGAQPPDSCWVFESAIRGGRVVAECVATCRGGGPAA